MGLSDVEVDVRGGETVEVVAMLGYATPSYGRLCHAISYALRKGLGECIDGADIGAGGCGIVWLD